jgi:outer membrane lipoprotein LolB
MMQILSTSGLISSIVRSRKAIAIGLSALLMTGCANLAMSPESGQTSDAATSTNRRYNEIIDLQGRLSVQYQLNGKDESVHGSFTWRQNDNRSTIAILSPLGQILATIDVEPDKATLTQSGRPPRTASNVDELTTQALGWPLPISGLRTWLQGFGTDADNKPFSAAPGGNEVTTRDGWRIRYVTWDDGHPKRIDLERQTEQAGNVGIRIVLDAWQAP